MKINLEDTARQIKSSDVRRERPTANQMCNLYLPMHISHSRPCKKGWPTKEIIKIRFANVVPLQEFNEMKQSYSQTICSKTG